MIQQFTTAEARKHLKDLIEAALRGETIQILKDDQAGVELVPLSAVKVARKFGSAKGQVQMADDFNAPLEDFAVYTK